MSDPDDTADDDTPIEVPVQVAERPARRRYVQPEAERHGRSARARSPLPSSLVAADPRDVIADGAGPHPEVHDEITGVAELQERTDRDLARLEVSADIRRGIAVAVAVMAQHQQHGEKRAANRDSQVLASRGGDDVGARLGKLEADQVDLTGKSGNNGKIGNLRGEVKLLRAVLVVVGLAALGGVGTAATALYQVGDENGAERVEREHLRDAVRLLIVQQAATSAALVNLQLQLGVRLAPGAP